MRGGVALHIGRGSTSHWTFYEPAVTLASPLARARTRRAPLSGEECRVGGEPPVAAEPPFAGGLGYAAATLPSASFLVASTPERLVMLMRVNSSETVGWMPTVPSKSRFLAPIFIATA